MQRRTRKSLRAVLASIASIGILVGLLTSLQPSLGESSGSSARQASNLGSPQINRVWQPYSEPQEQFPPVKTPRNRTIFAGLYVENIYNLSIKDRSFMAEGWYWLRWDEAVNQILQSANIKPEKMAEFTNQIDASSMVMEADQPDPIKLKNGDYWQQFRFSGKFYIPDQVLNGFPFVRLQLPIILELRPDLLSCYPGNEKGCFSLVQDPDSLGTKVGAYATLNGFDLKGMEHYEFLHAYNSNFGVGKESAFASISYALVYKTGFLAAFMSYIFPLLILILIVIISPSLPASLGDVRLAIPTTILLTLIFLQIGYKAELPSLAYINYLDLLYIFSYALSAGLFVLYCWGTNAYAKAAEGGNESSVSRQINRVDLNLQVIASLGLLIVLASGFLFNR